MLHIFAPLKTSSTNPSRKNKNIKVITNHTGIYCLVATSSDGSNYQDSKGDSQEEVRVDRSGPSSRRPLNAFSVKPNVNDTASHVHNVGSSVTKCTYSIEHIYDFLNLTA